jgi:HrpA-like RNA helicase
MATIPLWAAQWADLPTLQFRQQITDAVDKNQVVVLTAETGAGKSTQVPQYLAEHGYTRVIVTQPRILAARTLAHRVREEWGARHDIDATDVVGYRTAHEREDSGQTKILYCTDGLQLVREITGSGTSEKQVLVLDEVHEWNENMEVLVAWAKKRILEDPTFRVVIMSATIETDALAEYYGTKAVINVPGRHFEVKKRTGEDLLAELFTQLEHPGKAVLTFLPGKAEIQAVADALESRAQKAGVEIIPLHSQLEAEAQQKAFQNFPGGKIILATNIAQTSVTIDDVDVVIDSGLERRSEVRSGVEGLFIAQISQADCAQRAGRAGRTKPGEYILAPYDNLPSLPIDKRLPYPTPEIMRKHIDRLTLRLANIGIDIEELDFYHDPGKKSIQRAKRLLVALGAMTRSGEVTNIGRAMERFPVESSYARMLIEGEQYSADIQAKLAAIIAIQEVGGVIKGGTKYSGWRTFTKQTKSDLLAEYDVYRAVANEATAFTDDELEEMGIITKNLVKAGEVIERLHRDLSLNGTELAALTDDDEAPLLQSIVAGQIDQLWFMNDEGKAEHIFTGSVRELSSNTVVRNPRLLSGTPFDLQIPTRSGLEVLNLLTAVTAVEANWLLQLSSDEFRPGPSRVLFDPRINGLARRQQLRIGKRLIEGQSQPLLEDTSEHRQLFQREFSKWCYDQLEKQRRNFERFHKHVPSISLKQVEHAVKARTWGLVSLDQLRSAEKREAMALAKLETYVGDDFVQHLGVPRHGRAYDQRRDDRDARPRRHGWKPQHKRKYRKDNW